MGRKRQRGAPGETSIKAESQPEQFGVEKKYGSGHTPGNDGGETRIDEFPHLRALAGEAHQRNHREGQLKTQDDLAEDQQCREFAFPGDADHQHGGKNRDEPANPWLQAKLQESFHHNLTRQSSGELLAERVAPFYVNYGEPPI